MRLSPGKKLLALGGFLVLGLSPSFVDWQQSPDKRKQIILFYGAGTAMFWYGLLK
jgi:hypothetical protein